MWILQNTITVLGIGGYALMGILVFVGYFKKDDGRRKESDLLADGLINRLQQTVDQQTKDIGKMKEDVAKYRDELKHLQGRNSILEELFKGRDPAMQEFLKESPILLQVTKENNGIAKEMSQGLSNLESTIARFVDTLQPLLIHIDGAN